MLFYALRTDAHTVADVDYKWKGGKGVEIVSSEMAQFDLLRVVTENEASTNSKGWTLFLDGALSRTTHFLSFYLRNLLI